MSRSFTIVPQGDFAKLADELELAATLDPAIKVVAEGVDRCLYFAGDIGVVPLAPGGRGLACVRILRGSWVLHVDAEGYEGSVEHLLTFLRALFHRLGRDRGVYKVLDDETGDDLTWQSLRLPGQLVAPEPEFADPDT